MRFSMYTLYSMLIFGALGAFLQDQLPLQVLSITPNELTKVGQTNRQAVLLRGIDPITVVFTRPVIALGSDFQPLNRSVQGGLGGAQNPFTLVDLQGNQLNVSGKLRWPTTYIARFDPDGPWPTDLEFTLNLNSNLQTYDGVNLTVSGAAPAFQTSFLSGSFTSVDSKLGQNATGGAWSPTVGTETEPEAPPDAEIRYEFSNPVNLDMIRKSFVLSIKQGSLGNEAVRFAACPPLPPNPILFNIFQQQQQTQDPSSCVLIRPTNLVPQASYMLTLPAGTTYHQNAGPSHRPLTFIFHGLYPFTFTPQTFGQYFQPRYRRLDFYLRHGLAANSDISAFRRALTISSTGVNNLPFNVSRPDNVTLRVIAAFQPNTQYFFGFSNANIQDGFGQTFQGLNFSFTTAPTSAIFTEPTNNNDYAVFATNNAPSSWEVMTRAGTAPQQQQMTLALGAVNPSNFANSLTARGYQASRFATTVQSQPASNNFNIQNLTLPSNFFLRQRVYANYDGTTNYQGAYTSITDLGVSVIASGGAVDVWVTNMSSGANVPGAQVTVYSQQSWNQNAPAILVGQNTTGQDGTTTVQNLQGDNNNNGGQYVMYVSKFANGRQDQTMVEYYPGSVSDTPVTASIVMDRGVYKPGDSINLKVFATKRQGTTLKPFTDAGCSMLVQWEQSQPPSWQPVQQSVPVQWDSTFGTWFTSIDIPANITFGSKTVSVVTSNQNWITSATILIADPRRPTASLDFSVDPIWVLGNNLIVNATVMTGTNQPIAGANINVTWTATTYYSSTNNNQPVNNNGSFILTTGSDGTVSKQDFTLNGVRAGETYSFDATYVGPTGEVLQQNAQANTATSTWLITLVPDSKFGALTNLPGFQFGWIVNIYDGNGQEVGGSGSITLYPVNSNNASSTCRFNKQAGQTGSVCTGFTLPGVGAFVAVGSTRDNQNHVVSANQTLGRSADDWKSNPLDKYFLQDFGFSLDKTSYAVGDTAQVRFDNPFTGATMWINGNGINQQVPATIGTNQASFTVPQSCYGGCSVSVVVAVPAQPASFASKVRASGVPISVWTDLRAPRSFQSSLNLNVPDVNRQINVTITPPGRSAPGDTVTFSVKLNDQNNAPVTGEVAIFVVDRAFLQVSPYPLTHLNDSFAISSNQYLSSFDNRQSLISWTGAVASVNTYANRLAQDPWADYSESQADQSDEDFFRYLSTRVTEWGMGNNNMGQLRARGVAVPMMAYSTRVEASPMMASDSIAPMPMGTVSKLEVANGPGVTGSTGAAQSAADIPVRTKFETTPLFIGRQIVSGSGNFQLTLPDNIGTFSIRAYVVDANSRFGQAEAEVTATKILTIQPLFPRFARPGDVFDCGVIVSGDSSNYNKQVNVSIATPNSTVALTGGNSASVQVSGTTPVKVKFPMTAVKIGPSYFKFTAQDPQRGQDAFQDEFDILATQDPVTIATSMAIQASPNGTQWDEGIAFPAMVPGSGSLSLTAAVGRLPVVENLASVVLNATQKTNPDEDAYSYLSRALLRNVFTRYPNAQGPVETMANDQFSGVVAALRRLTDSRLGLRWSNRNPLTADSTPDTALNFYGMYVAFRSYLQRSVADINRVPFRGMRTPVAPTQTQNGQNNQNGQNGLNQNGGIQNGMMSPNMGMMSRAAPMMPNPDVVNQQVAPPPFQPSSFNFASAPPASFAGASAQGPQPVQFAPVVTLLPPPPPVEASFAGSPSFSSSRPGRGLLQLLQQQTLVSPAVPQFLMPRQQQQQNAQQQPQQSSQPFAGNLLPLDLVQTWATALERGIVNEYYDAVRYGNNFTDWDLLADTLTVLGLDWTAPKLQYNPSSGPSVAANATPADVLSLRNLQANVNQLSYAGQVQLALAYVLRGESNPLIGQVVNQTLARILVQGRTAYLKAGPGSNNAAATNAQAAALELLSLTNVNHPFVEKLANYLAQGNVGNAGTLYSFSSQGNALSALAFAVYDQAKQNVNANANLKVTSGNRQVLNGNFQSANSPAVSATINPDTLPHSNSTGAAQPLQFVAQGTGEISVAALINFVPAQISPDPIYRGIYVERTVQRANGGKGTGPALQLVQSGDFVVVTIQITSPDDLAGVLIQDLLPGGLEAVDPNLSGGSGSVSPPPMPMVMTSRSNRLIYPPWRDPFGSATVYPDRVTWQADYLRQGTYSVSYTAVAVTTGTFLHPPTKVMALAQPEVMGLSGGGFLVVSEDLIAQAQQSQYLKDRNVAPLQPLRPMDCKTPCPASGYCNLRTGTCQPMVEMRMLSAVAPIASNIAGKVSSAVQSTAATTTNAVQSAAATTAAGANAVVGKGKAAVGKATTATTNAAQSAAATTVAGTNAVVGKGKAAAGKVTTSVGKATAKAGKATAKAGKNVQAAVPP